MSKTKRFQNICILTSCVWLSLVGACSAPNSAPELRTLSEQNLVDILVGSCIQSTRNCDPSQSIADVKTALAEGLVFRTILPGNVPEDGMVVAVQGIGGGGPWQHVIDRTTEQGLPILEDPRRNVVELFADIAARMWPRSFAPKRLVRLRQRSYWALKWAFRRLMAALLGARFLKFSNLFHGSMVLRLFQQRL
jgi:hypothetical protein